MDLGDSPLPVPARGALPDRAPRSRNLLRMRWDLPTKRTASAASRDTPSGSLESSTSNPPCHSAVDTSSRSSPPSSECRAERQMKNSPSPPTNLPYPSQAPSWRYITSRMESASTEAARSTQGTPHTSSSSALLRRAPPPKSSSCTEHTREWSLETSRSCSQNLPWSSARGSVPYPSLSRRSACTTSSRYPSSTSLRPQAKALRYALPLPLTVSSSLCLCL